MCSHLCQISLISFLKCGAQVPELLNGGHTIHPRIPLAKSPSSLTDIISIERPPQRSISSVPSTLIHSVHSQQLQTQSAQKIGSVCVCVMCIFDCLHSAKCAVHKTWSSGKGTDVSSTEKEETAEEGCEYDDTDDQDYSPPLCIWNEFNQKFCLMKMIFLFHCFFPPTARVVPLKPSVYQRTDTVTQ